MPDWNRQARNRDARLERAAHLTSTKLVPASEARALLEAVLEPGDRVCLEGNNQKQADPKPPRRQQRRGQDGRQPGSVSLGAGRLVLEHPGQPW